MLDSSGTAPSGDMPKVSHNKYQLAAALKASLILKPGININSSGSPFSLLSGFTGVIQRLLHVSSRSSTQGRVVDNRID